jgi:hypothetical protein
MPKKKIDQIAEITTNMEKQKINNFIHFPFNFTPLGRWINRVLNNLGVMSSEDNNTIDVVSVTEL